MRNYEILLLLFWYDWYYPTRIYEIPFLETSNLGQNLPMMSEIIRYVVSTSVFFLLPLITLWEFNIALENGPCMDDLPPFSIIFLLSLMIFQFAMSNTQRVNFHVSMVFSILQWISYGFPREFPHLPLAQQPMEPPEWLRILRWRHVSLWGYSLKHSPK